MSRLLEVHAVTKQFGGLTAVDAASLRVETGSITGLIGPNGAGKTTLFSVISGFETASSGTVSFAVRGETALQDITALPAHKRALAGVARTFQIVQPFAGLSVRENIAVGAFLRNAARNDALAKADAVGHAVGLGPLMDSQAQALTVAGRKRLELARALATEPKLLLLDEVLAGLNPSEIRDMIPVIQHIRATGVTVLLVEHVMQAVMSLCDTVYVLAQGKIIAEGIPKDIARNDKVVEAYLGHGAAARMRAHENGPHGDNSHA
jgi:branched-chain amino acid transport system ATP-binding protein